jgi:hypothetical protein
MTAAQSARLERFCYARAMRQQLRSACIVYHTLRAAWLQRYKQRATRVIRTRAATQSPGAP